MPPSTSSPPQQTGTVPATTHSVPQNPPIASLSFEQALQELEKIVGNLERGDVPLEESIDIYERGEALRHHCETLLKKAEQRIEKVHLNQEGAPVGGTAFDEE